MSNQECHECWGTGMSCATPGRPCNACRPEVWLQTIVGEHQSDLERVTRERDEARAEVRRLVEVVKEAQSLTSGAVQDGVERVLRGLLSTRGQQIASLTRERDEAMGLMRENQRLTGEATQQALDSAVRLGKMADAVRALLADVESQHGEKMDFCDAPRCRRLAMYNDGDMAACDEHQGILVAGDIEDMSYAPFVRTLRAMIEGKPGEPCGAVERLKVENEALRAALASDGEAMANLCGLLGLTDAVVSREEGQQMVHAAVKKLKVERDEMRSAARALLAELDKEARSCGKCYRLATVAEGLPRGGFVFACDKHATPPSTEWQDDPCQNYPTNVAAPLRTLRALLADPSTR